MKSKILGLTLGFPLVTAGLLAFSTPSKAAVLDIGSELQIGAGLVLPGTGEVLFVPEVSLDPANDPTLVNPSTPAVGEYGFLTVQGGANTGSFEVYNTPNDPFPPGTSTISGGALNFLTDPVTNQPITGGGAIPDLIRIPGAFPVGGETASALAAPTNFSTTSMDIIGVNLLGNADLGGGLIIPVFESFQITGKGFFLNDGDISFAEYSLTTQGFDSTINPDGSVTIDPNGSISGTITVVAAVPERTSILSLMGAGALITAGLTKRSQKKLK